MINDWYNLQVNNLPETTKTWGKRYRAKFEKNLLDVLDTFEWLRINDLIELSMYLDIEYDKRINCSLNQLERDEKIGIFQTEECIYLIKT